LFDLFYNSSTNTTKHIENKDSSNLDLIKINSIFSSIKSNENNSQIIYAKNFIWKLLLNQFDLDFYLVESANASSSNNKNLKQKHQTCFTNRFRSLAASKSANHTFSAIVSTSQVRGFCENYSHRKCLNTHLKPSCNIHGLEEHHFVIRSYQDCVNE
jgi:hypothetical protein